MQLIKNKKRLKLSLGIIITSFIMTMSLLGGKNVNAADYRLTANHTMGDIYASAIFSEGTEKTIDSVNFSYEELARYPSVADSDQASNQIYGSLENDGGRTVTGRKISNLLYSYHKYSYIATVPKDGVMKSLWHWMTGNDGGHVNDLNTAALNASLNSAIFGAQMFDMFDGMIDGFKEAMRNFDVPTLLGFTSSDPKTAGNLMQKVMTSIFEALSIDRTAIQVFKYTFWTFLIGGSLLGIISLLGRSDMPGGLKLVGRLMLRVFVMSITLTATGHITTAIDDATDGLTDANNLGTQFANSYVVDSLAFSVATNLDPTAINPYVGEELTSTSKIKQKIKSIKPTETNISNLNKNINSRLNGSKFSIGVDTSSLDEKKASKLTATEMLEGLASKQVVSVNDYFAAISSSSDANIAAKNGFVASGDSISAGASFSKKSYNEVYTNNSYFLSQSTDPKNVPKDYADVARKEIEGDNKEDSSDYMDFNTIKIQGTNVAMNQKGYYNGTKLKATNPRSYIFGSTSSNSDATADYHNYTNGAGTVQNNNPYTGDDEYSDEEKDLKKAMFTNSLAIALANRYGGMNNSSSYSINDPRYTGQLSTQSVAFILQSHMTNDGITYAGYNTTKSDADKGKPTSANGNVFVRFVIPNTGKLNLMGKIGVITLVYLMAGVAGFVAFLTLLKAPIFSATVKMIMKFASAIMTGNVISLIEYLAYYTAIQMSFAFAKMSIYIGVILGNLIVNMLPKWLAGGVAAGNITSGGGIVSGLDNLFGGDVATTNIPNMSTIFIMLIMLYFMAFPIMTLNLGGRSSKPRRVSLIGVVCMLPYLMVEALDEYLDQYHRILYGKSKNRTFLNALSRQGTFVAPTDKLKEDGKKAVGAGIAIGGAIMTGGASLMGTATSMAAKKMSTGAEESADDTSLAPRGGFINGIKNRVENVKGKVGAVQDAFNESMAQSEFNESSVPFAVGKASLAGGAEAVNQLIGKRLDAMESDFDSRKAMKEVDAFEKQNEVDELGRQLQLESNPVSDSPITPKDIDGRDIDSENIKSKDVETDSIKAKSVEGESSKSSESTDNKTMEVGNLTVIAKDGMKVEGASDINTDKAQLNKVESNGGVEIAKRGQEPKQPSPLNAPKADVSPLRDELRKRDPQFTKLDDKANMKQNEFLKVEKALNVHKAKFGENPVDKNQREVRKRFESIRETKLKEVRETAQQRDNYMTAKFNPNSFTNKVKDSMKNVKIGVQTVADTKTVQGLTKVAKAGLHVNQPMMTATKVVGAMAMDNAFGTNTAQRVIDKANGKDVSHGTSGSSDNRAVQEQNELLREMIRTQNESNIIQRDMYDNMPLDKL